MNSFNGPLQGSAIPSAGFGNANPTAGLNLANLAVQQVAPNYNNSLGIANVGLGSPIVRPNNYVGLNNFVSVAAHYVCVPDQRNANSARDSQSIGLEAWMRTPEQQRFVRWGYTFEARCTGQAVADANAETNVLISTRVGALRVLLGAEIDCCDAGEPSTAPLSALSSLRELKTFKQPQHRGQWRTQHRLKHPKWWLQSHLAGVPALVLGARDDSGIVHAIHTVPTHDLPRLSQLNGEAWSPHAALAFGADALAWFRRTAARHAGAHVRFTYDPASGAIHAAVVADGSLPARLAAALARA